MDRRTSSRYCKADIDVIEISENMRHILKNKGFRVVHDDFLTYKTFKRYDLILMNPPFSNGGQHLLHAMELLAADGTIVCILNAETIRNPYTNARKRLLKTLTEWEAVFEYRENEFTQAERKTTVEIVMVRAKKSTENYQRIILDHLQKADAETPPETETPHPLVSGDYIKAMIAEYNFRMSLGVALINEYYSLQSIEEDLIKLEIDDFHDIKYNDRDKRHHYVKRLRYHFWKRLFNRSEFTDRLTTNVLKDLHSRLLEFSDYEFSYFNIYQLFIDLSGEIIENIKKTILAVFDDFTYRHAWAEYSKNILHYNGWKTNDAFMIRNKVIYPTYGDNFGWKGKFSPSYQLRGKLVDIEKSFDYLDGSLVDVHDSLDKALKNAADNNQSRNIDCRHFTLSVFKKGTIHLCFKNPELVKKFNIFAGQHKNYLPPGYGVKSYAEMSADEKRVVDNFEGKAAYAQTLEQSDYYIYKPAMPMLAAPSIGDSDAPLPQAG